MARFAYPTLARVESVRGGWPRGVTRPGELARGGEAWAMTVSAIAIAAIASASGFCLLLGGGLCWIRQGRGAANAAAKSGGSASLSSHSQTTQARQPIKASCSSTR